MPRYSVRRFYSTYVDFEVDAKDKEDAITKAGETRWTADESEQAIVNLDYLMCETDDEVVELDTFNPSRKDLDVTENTQR